MTKNDKKTWSDFIKLHFNEAEKKTRSNKSWDIQFKNINRGNSILMYCKKGDKLIGGAYFDLSNNEALYSVGVYSKHYKDIPISHILQFKAIKELKKRNIRWYKLGQYLANRMNKYYTNKDFNIAFFKLGFASEITTNFKIYI